MTLWQTLWRAGGRGGGDGGLIFRFCSWNTHIFIFGNFAWDTCSPPRSCGGGNVFLIPTYSSRTPVWRIPSSGCESRNRKAFSSVVIYQARTKRGTPHIVLTGNPCFRAGSFMFIKTAGNFLSQRNFVRKRFIAFIHCHKPTQVDFHIGSYQTNVKK